MVQRFMTVTIPVRFPAPNRQLLPENRDFPTDIFRHGTSHPMAWGRRPGCIIVAKWTWDQLDRLTTRHGLVDNCHSFTTMKLFSSGAHSDHAPWTKASAWQTICWSRIQLEIRWIV